MREGVPCIVIAALAEALNNLADVVAHAVAHRNRTRRVAPRHQQPHGLRIDTLGAVGHGEASLVAGTRGIARGGRIAARGTALAGDLHGGLVGAAHGPLGKALADQGLFVRNIDTD